MWQFNSSVKFCGSDFPIEAKVVTQYRQSYLIWTGSKIIWVSGKKLFDSNNQIEIPISEKQIDFYKKEAKSILEIGSGLQQNDLDNLSEQLAAAYVREYLYNFSLKKGLMETDK